MGVSYYLKLTKAGIKQIQRKVFGWKLETSEDFDNIISMTSIGIFPYWDD